jgi:hypothetical protein
MVNLQEMDLWLKSYIPMGVRNQFSDKDLLINDYQFITDLERQHNARYEHTFTREDPNYIILTDKTQSLVPIFTFISKKLGIRAVNVHRHFGLGVKRLDQVLIPIYEKFLRSEKLTAQQRSAESEAEKQADIQRRISGAAETRLSQRVRERIRRENPQATGMQIDQLVKEELHPTEPEPQPVEIQLKSYYVWTRFSVTTIPSRPGLVFPIKQVFSQPKLSASQVTQLRNLGKTVILADFELAGSTIQRGIDEMNKIAQRNTGIKEIRIG